MSFVSLSGSMRTRTETILQPCSPLPDLRRVVEDFVDGGRSQVYEIDSRQVDVIQCRSIWT